MLLFLALAAAPQPPSAPGVTRPRLQQGSIASEDYPAAAVQAEETGSVRALLNVAADGRVAGCEVVETSGSAVLDATTCSLMRQRYRFSPARNRAGEPVASTSFQVVRWRLPKDVTPTFPPFEYGELRVLLAMGPNDPGCAVETRGSAFLTMEKAICPDQLRTEPQRLAARRDVVMQSITLTPEGAAPARPAPVRGTLLGSVVADIEVDSSGRVSSCRQTNTGESEGAPQICAGMSGPGQSFVAAPAQPLRRGQVRVQLYRMGAPET